MGSPIALHSNRIREAHKRGEPAFGTYVKTPSPMMIELLAYGGFDFVRVDLNAGHMNTETVENMIRTAHSVGITPIVRVERNDPLQIQAVIDMGALGIIVPEVTGRDDVAAAVRAAKLPPHGERHPGGAKTSGYGMIRNAEYAAWAAENIILSVQVETKKAVEEIDAIAAIPGLDMVQSGRGTLSYEFGVPGEQYHPTVLNAERTVVERGLRAGKMVGLQYYPLRERSHVQTVKDWIKRGVLCHSLGIDTDIAFVFRQLMKDMRTATSS
jgi:4-hydroxy-2-oxoheptanedioate aldolase